MQASKVFEGESVAVYDYRCTAGPADKPYVEVRDTHSLSYVRSGSFGCRTLGEEHELVAGAVLVVQPGREYMATHEHHGCGDECLSIRLSGELAESANALWNLAKLPPLPELMVLGELAQAAVDGRTAVGVDEAALLFVVKASTIASGGISGTLRMNSRERKKAVETALWLEANAAEPVGLEHAARYAGLSPFHFLRLFSKVTGVTPDQYLVRTRLRRAARLLSQEDMPITELALDCGFADLSNFVRTFRRASGMSPGKFRKKFQDRHAALA
jgi:AraC family transcriptional regulator